MTDVFFCRDRSERWTVPWHFVVPLRLRTVINRTASRSRFERKMACIPSRVNCKVARLWLSVIQMETFIKAIIPSLDRDCLKGIPDNVFRFELHHERDLHEFWLSDFATPVRRQGLALMGFHASAGTSRALAWHSMCGEVLTARRGKKQLSRW